MKIKIRKPAALLTFFLFLWHQLAFCLPINVHVLSFSRDPEIKTSPAFAFSLSPELGTIESFHAGTGPILIHLQTAHGHEDIQKKITAILQDLKERYGFHQIFIEGSAFPLHRELLQFFTGQEEMRQKILAQLLRAGLLKAPELFLSEADGVEVQGIENLNDYAANAKALRAVLSRRKAAENFIRGADRKTTEQTNRRLNKDLRNFLKEAARYEGKSPNLLDHLLFLKDRAQKVLALDLSDPRHQIEWPNLLRFFKLREFESKIDLRAFEKERARFFKILRLTPQEIYQPIEKLFLNPFGLQEISDPETGLLFEKMVSYLPASFEYRAFPNVRYAVGSLILKSELKVSRLMAEARDLEKRIAERLAKTPAERGYLQRLRRYALLKKLLRLELTSEEYEELIRDKFFPLPWEEGSGEGGLDPALEFYRRARQRDSSMLQNIERLLEKTGVQKAVLVTGGFHAAAFEKYFRERKVTYALVSPKIGTLEENPDYFDVFLKYQSASPSSSALEIAPLSGSTRSELRRLGFDADKVKAAVFETISGVIRSELRALRLDPRLAPPLPEAVIRQAIVSAGRLGRDEVDPEAARVHFFGNFARLFEEHKKRHGTTQQDIVDYVSKGHLPKAHSGMMTHWFGQEGISRENASRAAEYLLGNSYPGTSSGVLLARMAGIDPRKPIDFKALRELFRKIFPVEKGRHQRKGRRQRKHTGETKREAKPALHDLRKRIRLLQKGQNPKKNFVANLEILMEALGITQQEIVDIAAPHIVEERGMGHAGMASHWFRRGGIKFEYALKAARHVLKGYYPDASELKSLAILAGNPRLADLGKRELRKIWNKKRPGPRSRSELRETAAETKNTWFTDPDHADWGPESKPYRKVLILQLLRSLGVGPNELIEKPGLLRDTPLDFLDGKKNLKGMYDYYDRLRQEKGLPSSLSTIQYLLYDTDFENFKGWKDLKEYFGAPG